MRVFLPILRENLLLACHRVSLARALDTSTRLAALRYPDIELNASQRYDSRMKDADPVVQEYSAAAKDYDTKWAFYVESTTRETLRRLPIAANDRVLDVGCGTGELLARLAARYPDAQLAGLDPVEEMLAVAKAKLSEKVDLRVGWANELPWADHSFDVVVSCNMFHYITHPVAAVREMERVVRPGGKVVITDWCDDYLACRLCNLYLRFTTKAHSRLTSRPNVRRF